MDSGYFGNCPKCGGNDGMITCINGDHWGVCERHKTRWLIGNGLFTIPAEHMDEAIENVILIARYQEVNPTDLTAINGGKVNECLNAIP